MAMAWKQMLSNRTAVSPQWIPGFQRFYSKPSPFVVKVGIPEFLKGVGRGIETHTAKLETEIGDFQKLLVVRTLRLKKLGIPVKHECSYPKDGLLFKLTIEAGCENEDRIRISNLDDDEPIRKLILNYAHKYRLGLWRPRAMALKS